MIRQLPFRTGDFVFISFDVFDIDVVFGFAQIALLMVPSSDR